MNEYVLVASSWIVLRELFYSHIFSRYIVIIFFPYMLPTTIYMALVSHLLTSTHNKLLNLNKSWVPYVYCMYSHSYSEAIHPLWSRYGLEIMSIHPEFSFKIHNKLVNKASQLNGNSPQQHVTFIEVNEL